MTITAKYRGTCRVCGGAISVGDRIEWSKSGGARHVDCAGSSTTTRAPRRRSAETKNCWECGRNFTFSDMTPDGEWSDSYCGC